MGVTILQMMEQLVMIFLLKSLILTVTFMGKSIGGISYDQGSTISIDDSGYVYVAGYYMNTVDFDPGPSIYNLSTIGGGNPYILKLDSSGNFVWAKTFAAIGQPQSIHVDGNGFIYTTGFFKEQVILILLLMLQI
ncbi:MAG: hypothetical protein IPG89_19250 [Bacteroidetes bacterium]|nr:hypothetical protein [Bacteroidota bacterium]